LNDTVVILLLPCALEATVLRETDPQTTIWELLLPEEAKRLPADCKRSTPTLMMSASSRPGGRCLTGG
jgi:hypothetical protein